MLAFLIENRFVSSQDIKLYFYKSKLGEFSIEDLLKDLDQSGGRLERFIYPGPG